MHHCGTSKNYNIGGLLWKENDGVEAMRRIQCNLYSISVSQRPKSPHTISMCLHISGQEVGNNVFQIWFLWSLWILFILYFIYFFSNFMYDCSIFRSHSTHFPISNLLYLLSSSFHFPSLPSPLLFSAFLPKFNINLFVRSVWKYSKGSHKCTHSHFRLQVLVWVSFLIKIKFYFP